MFRSIDFPDGLRPFCFAGSGGRRSQSLFLEFRLSKREFLELPGCPCIDQQRKSKRSDPASLEYPRAIHRVRPGSAAHSAGQAKRFLSGVLSAKCSDFVFRKHCLHDRPSLWRHTGGASHRDGCRFDCLFRDVEPDLFAYVKCEQCELREYPRR